MFRAIEETKEKKKELEKLFDRDRKFLSEDTSFVVFGSLARREWTFGSDLDWTFLIDGEAHPEHLLIAQEIRDLLDKQEIVKPGRTGIFGNLSFSHDLIHHIGGEHDSNRNTTQRILLLLESTPVGRRDAYERVIAGILNRYIDMGDGRRKIFPRFLLNDVVRFWRTMAVDFANKQWERRGHGFGIRNIKLRMSRKLIFASGLLICFSCLHRRPDEIDEWTNGYGHSKDPLINRLRAFANLTPLEVVADAAQFYQIAPEISLKLFNSYDQFIDRLNTKRYREHLQVLRAEDAATSAIFKEMVEISHQFRDALLAFFFEGSEALSHAMKEYGVF